MINNARWLLVPCILLVVFSILNARKRAAPISAIDVSSAPLASKLKKNQLIPDGLEAVTPAARVQEPQVQGKTLPSATFLKNNPRWKPIHQLKMDPLCYEVLGLTEKDGQILEEILSSVRSKAGNQIGQNCLVAIKPNGAQLAYIPPDPAAWAGVETDFRGKLRDLLGLQLSEYILKSSAMDIDLLTGHFGQFGRMIDIYPAIAHEEGAASHGSWTAFYYMGNVSGKPFAKYFDDAELALLRQGNSSEIRWQDYYQFVDVPDFLSGLITKE